MRIDSIITKKLSFPIKPLTTHLRTYNHLNGLICYIYTKTGLYGTSFLYGIGNTSIEEIVQHINNLKNKIIEKSAANSLARWKQFWADEFTLQSTAETFALAAVDIAVWDLFAKSAQKSLSCLLSSDPATQIPVYGTTGWLSLSKEELINECKKYASLGINGFKIRLGTNHDYERVAAVRNAMDSNYRIMLDANERYSYEEAKNIITSMADLNICWIEEPLKTHSKDYALLKRNSPIPVAVGENIFTAKEFKVACNSKLADILQPDVMRCGGITGFINIATTAQKHQLPLCNHLLSELSVSLLAAFPNHYLLEYEDILPKNIYTNYFPIIDGAMTVPAAPGTGVELTLDAIKEFEI